MPTVGPCFPLTTAALDLHSIGVFQIVVKLPHEPYEIQIMVCTHGCICHCFAYDELGIDSGTSSRPASFYRRATKHLSVLLFPS